MMKIKNKSYGQTVVCPFSIFPPIFSCFVDYNNNFLLVHQYL